MRVRCPHCSCTHPSRETGDCVQCGRIMEPAPYLVDEGTAAEFYDRICDIMREGYELPCNVRRPAVERFFKLGHRQYGDEYLMRDNAAEGQDEACDGSNYALMESHRLILEDLDPGDEEMLRGLLIEAGVLAAKMYEKFAQYTADLKECRSMIPRA